MGAKRLFIAVFLSFFLFLPTAKGEEHKIIPDSVRYQMAKALNIDPYDPRINQVLNRANIGLKAILEKRDRGLFKDAAVTNDISKALDLEKFILLSEHWRNPKVKKHIVVGGGRKIVQTPAALPSLPKPSKDTVEAVKRFKRNLIKPFEEIKEIEPLPVCTYRKTRRVKTLPILGGKPLPQGLKLLFLAVRVPTDAGEYFGYDTLVVECSGKKGDTCALVSQLMNLRCLPARFNFKKSFVEIIEGPDALKNYQLRLKGGFHPMVKAKLDLFMGLEN